MNALSIIEAISAEVLVSGTIKKPVVDPKLVQLQALLFDSTSMQFFALLQKRIDVASESSHPDGPKLVLEILDSLSRHLVMLNDPRTGELRAGRSSSYLVAIGKLPAEEPLKYDNSQPNDILTQFLLEYYTYLQNIDAQLSILYSDHENKEALNTAFRIFHSLKGNCGFMELNSARTLAHEAETVLDRARNGSMPLNTTACEVLLKAIAALRDIGDAVRAHFGTPEAPFPTLPGSVEGAVIAVRTLVSDTRDSIPTPRVLAAVRIDSINVPVIAKLNAPATLAVHTAKYEALHASVERLVALHAQTPAGRGEHPDEIIVCLNDVQRQLKEMRRVPIKELFKRMTRLSRDLARRQGKELEVSISGEDVELESELLETLADPLMHLIINAVDHGIATPDLREAAGKPVRGRLTLNARRENGVIIEVADDGNGLDFEGILNRAREISLISADDTPSIERLCGCLFKPGFSTTARVTEVSGRGVGLDVVKRIMDALGGSVSVNSEAGKGTTFSLLLP